MSEETRQRILAAGAELIHTQGYNNTGLKDILKAADVPKGSFYFYFDSKEAFGIELLDFFGEHFRGVVNEILKDESITPLNRLKNFFASFHSFFEAHGYSRGCPVGNLAQEMGDLSEPFRAKLQEAIDGMTAALVFILGKAQDAGEISSDLDVRETAIFIIEAWHGAIIRMKITKTSEPLDIFGRLVFDNLLK